MIVSIYKVHTKEIDIKYRVYNYYFHHLIKANKLHTKNILVDEKHYKDLVVYFTRHFHSKLIKMLSLHYYELIGKIEEYAGKKYLMVDNSMLD